MPIWITIQVLLFRCESHWIASIRSENYGTIALTLKYQTTILLAITFRIENSKDVCLSTKLDEPAWITCSLNLA